MPRKPAMANEEPDLESNVIELNNDSKDDEAENLRRMLAAVLNYISDDDLEEIDIEFLLDDTEGLRDWWEAYQESNRKKIEEDIRKSLGELSLKDLEKIRKQIKDNKE